MSTVLVLATRYDRSLSYTWGWAELLRHDLLQQGHACMLLDGTLSNYSLPSLVMQSIVQMLSYIMATVPPRIGRHCRTRHPPFLNLGH